MRRHTWKIAAVMAVLFGFALPIASAGAATHPTYPLGSTKSCKAHYVKRILSHEVKGKTVKYTGCVYVAPKAPAAAMHQVGTGHASGDYAIAMASGTANQPSKIELSVTATPAQSAMVSWDLVCTEKGGIDSVGSKSGQATLNAPGVELLVLPGPSTSCIVSASVQISTGGAVTISIESSS